MLCLFARAQDKGQADLVDKMPKNIGTAIGIELRDNSQALSATNQKLIKAGMTFNVALGEFRSSFVLSWKIDVASS